VRDKCIIVVLSKKLMNFRAPFFQFNLHLCHALNTFPSLAFCTNFIARSFLSMPLSAKYLQVLITLTFTLSTYISSQFLSCMASFCSMMNAARREARRRWVRARFRTRVLLDVAECYRVRYSDARERVT